VPQYNPEKIEQKWQRKWEKERFYQARDFDEKRKKYYLLIEYPYPSGERLHTGHGRSYCAFDAIARMKRMQGFNVLYPFGWDAFGLPAENYAIKTGIHPSITTKENIANARKQAKSWGLSFDWSREINTTDPEYYKWTQWIFLQFFKHGLAYKSRIPVNWCPSCKINLANEEVVAGACERCGNPVKRRMQEQWMLKITAYADRLVDDLDLVNYREDIKQQQINWIGRSKGTKIKFRVQTTNYIEVFTTRADTLFGATFLVLAPEHPLVKKITAEAQRKRVEAYVKSSLKKSELQRQEEIKEKTGVFSGTYARHPITGEKIPIWVSDFVLSSYGTGAIMAVPAHDQRDFEFAKKFGIPIKEVIENKSDSSFPKEPFAGEGRLINSGQFDGLQSKKAIAKITVWLKKKGLGEPAVDYKLRDWVFSRQHYWGEPIPIIICEKCGYVPVPEEDLPVKLPRLEKFKPTTTGESPLVAAKDWVSVKCPKCGGSARRETDTMPNWAGSSWYFLRYIDPDNRKRFAEGRKLKYWMPIDWYNGGMEHTTLHLLYSRFWHKFLFDLGLVPGPEPYQKRTSHGVVLGQDGQKMSKSRGNVVNPDDVIEEFGADTFRIYEMFMGPFEQGISWDQKGVIGVHRFLERVWRSSEEISNHKPRGSDKNLERRLHQLIKKVEEDLMAVKFNTAVAAMMEFINEVAGSKYQVARKDWGVFLRVLAPFAPHLAEELWSQLGQKANETPAEQALTVKGRSKRQKWSVHQQPWPKYDPKLIKEEVVTVVVQVDGKLRGKLEVERGKKKDEAIKLAKDIATVKPHLSGRKIAKTIFLPDKLVNFVTK
jgi:leucyl-tRNA synthetase